MTEEQSNKVLEYIKSNPKMTERFGKAEISTELVESFKKKFPNGGEIIVISAPWCGDCVELLPKFGKISKSLPEWNITLLERDTLSYEDRIRYNVQYIPTFIFFNQKNEEIGRIIEQPKFGSIEEDMMVFKVKP